MSEFIELTNVNINFLAELNHSLRSSFFSKKKISIIKAICSINLKIKDGDKLAIIGANGSGKTTLLKTIAGIYNPVEGKIHISSKPFSLIDIAMGLDEEGTGLENIYILGIQNLIPKKFIDENIDEIIKFSGLEESIYRDVKTYSSGMKTRLAVSIFINLRPKILICDEFLSASDKYFQNKFENRLKEIINNAGIFILATHDTSAIDKYCNRVIEMRNGKIVNDKKI
jgi:lipopolysaccharide transport system ATP-binding protein